MKKGKFDWDWVILVGYVAGTILMITVHYTLAAALLAAVSASLATTMLNRRTWKIDDETAKRGWVEFWGRGYGEELSDARFALWAHLFAASAFLLLIIRHVYEQIMVPGSPQRAWDFGVLPFAPTLFFTVFTAFAAFYWQKTRKIQNREEKYEHGD